MSSIAIDGLKLIEELTPFQRAQLDPTLDYLMDPPAQCYNTDESPPCVTTSPCPQCKRKEYSRS